MRRHGLIANSQYRTVVPRDDHPWTSMEWIIKHTQDRRPAPKYRQGLDQGKEALLSKIEAHMNVLAHGELDPQGSKQEAEKQDAHAKHLTELYRQLQGRSFMSHSQLNMQKI